MNKGMHSGISGILLLLVILLLLTILGIGFDFGYIEYSTRCGDKSVKECVSATPVPTPEPEKSVTATGSFSKKDYNVTVSMIIPLEGGEVVGSFSGDCNGSIRGSFDGSDNGAISGSASGSCKSPIKIPVPASATFSGTVNKEGKLVPISGTGSAVGFSGNGSLTLSY